MEKKEKVSCIIDRFEGEWAVVEFKGRVMADLPRALLPDDAAKGDVLLLEARIDREETDRRKREIEERVRRVVGEENRPDEQE